MSKGTGRGSGGQYSSSVSKTGTTQPPDTDRDNNEYNQTNDCKRNRENDALKKTPPSGRQVGFKSEH